MKKAKKMAPEAAKPAVLFDFDGTLMDTDPAVVVSFRYIFDKYGKADKFTPEVENEVIDEVPEKIMKKYFPRKDPKKCVYEYLIYQHDHMRDLIQPTPFIEDLLKYLKKNELPVFLLSSRDQESLMALLDSSGLTGYFDKIIGQESGEHSEISKEDLIKVCRDAGAEHAIYVSDSAANIKTAREAGAYTVAFLSDTRKTAHLVDASPDFITGDMMQIKKLLQGEPYWVAYVLAS